MIYLITYELSDESTNLEALRNEIRTWKWWHYLKSVWIISSEENVNIITQRLQSHLIDNDLLLVIDITNQPRNGWLPKKAWLWLRNQENENLQDDRFSNN